MGTVTRCTPPASNAAPSVDANCSVVSTRDPVAP